MMTIKVVNKMVILNSLRAPILWWFHETTAHFIVILIVSPCEYVHMIRGAIRKSEVLGSKGFMLQAVVSSLTWMLETKLRSFT